MTVGTFDGVNLGQAEWAIAIYAGCLAYAMSNVLGKSIVRFFSLWFMPFSTVPAGSK